MSPGKMIFGAPKKQCIATHVVPRKTHVDQSTIYMSYEVMEFCNGRGIQTIKLPFNDHQATGSVERTIGNFKNSVNSWKKIRRSQPCLTFFKQATRKILPFKADHRRGANTLLRDLTKNPRFKI